MCANLEFKIHKHFEGNGQNTLELSKATYGHALNKSLDALTS